VVAVTQGTWEQTRIFCNVKGSSLQCLSDPERKSYKDFGIDRGSLSAVLGPRVLLKGFRAAAHGHFIGRIVGDEFQLSGTFIVDKGIVRFAYYSKDASDNPSVKMLLSEIEKLSLLR